MTTAPEAVRHCTRCGASVTTRVVAGTPRRVCTQCEAVHYADPKVAVGVRVVRDGRLLLVRRAVNPERGRWALPGGFLDAGEDARAAAARETREETGVEVDVGQVLEVFGPSPRGADLFVLFAAVWVAGEPVAGDDAAAAAFVGPDDLPPLAFASTRAAVASWLGLGGDPAAGGVVRERT